MFLSKFSWKSVALLVVEENYAYDSCVIYSFFIMTLNTLPRINAGLRFAMYKQNSLMLELSEKLLVK